MESPPILKVVPLFEKAQASDVIGSLRRAADSIEAETEEDDRTVSMVAVQVTESGEIAVYGWGQSTRFHAIGVLIAAAAKL